MAKLLLILLIGLVFEAAGVVFLKKGITQVGEVKAVSAAEIVRVVKAGATSPSVLLGVFFEALFFACLLVLMAESDISFLWPLTALSFVMTTLAALIFLGEKVSSVRWAGVVFIMIGAALISYSEHAKPKPSPRSAARRSRSYAAVIRARTSASFSAAAWVCFRRRSSPPTFPGDLARARASFPSLIFCSDVINWLKSSGRSCWAVSRITRTVALGIFCSRQTAQDALRFHFHGICASGFAQRPLFLGGHRHSSRAMKARRFCSRRQQRRFQARLRVGVEDHRAHRQFRPQPSRESAGQHQLGPFLRQRRANRPLRVALPMPTRMTLTSLRSRHQLLKGPRLLLHRKTHQYLSDFALRTSFSLRTSDFGFHLMPASRSFQI